MSKLRLVGGGDMDWINLIDGMEKMLADRPQRGPHRMLTKQMMANPAELIELINDGQLFIVHRTGMEKILKLLKEHQSDKAEMERRVGRLPGS